MVLLQCVKGACRRWSSTSLLSSSSSSSSSQTTKTPTRLRFRQPPRLRNKYSTASAQAVQLKAQERIQEIDAVDPYPYSIRSPSPVLTDTFGREHTYLRISLTEKCNLRCTFFYYYFLRKISLTFSI